MLKCCWQRPGRLRQNRMSKVIVVDDNRNYLSTVCEELREMGIKTVGCETLTNAKWQVERAGQYDILLVDLVLGDGSGIDLLQWMRQNGRYQPFYLMTGNPSVRSCVETMRLGAVNYIEKDDLEREFYSIVKNIVAEQELMERRSSRLVFRRQSEQFQEIYTKIRHIANTNIRVTITGERGTGRSHLVEDLVTASGISKDRIVSVSCGMLHSAASASEEFFGHQRGAFSSASRTVNGKLEQANDGVLYLENVDLMPLEVQELLAPVLKEGRYTRPGSEKYRNVRFWLVSSSTIPLDEAVERGMMTYEFCTLCCERTINVPPLRETIADIVPLAEFFLEHYSKTCKFSGEAKDAMRLYPWLGNVRELRNVVKVAFDNCHDDVILPEHLDLRKSEESDNLVRNRKLHDEELDRETILEALANSNNNKKLAAKMLDISRSDLYYKMKAMGIPYKK